MWTAAITPSAPDLLVIGGTGFLGRHVITAAAGRVVATRHGSAPVGNGVEWHSLDLRDGGGTAAALIAELRPGAVINAAYVQHGPDVDAVTAASPGAMASACRDVGARFVHLSTDVVFDGTTDRPYVERDPPSPVHDYGRAKVAAEQAVGRADPGAVIVRTSLLYGDEADPGPQVEMTADPAITFYDDEYRNPLPVGVLAAACLELTARPDITGILHVAGSETLSRLSFARRVAPIIGIDPAALRGAPGPDRADRPRNCPLDTDLARALLATQVP